MENSQFGMSASESFSKKVLHSGLTVIERVSLNAEEGMHLGRLLDGRILTPSLQFSSSILYTSKKRTSGLMSDKVLSCPEAAAREAIPAIVVAKAVSISESGKKARNATQGGGASQLVQAGEEEAKRREEPTQERTRKPKSPRGKRTQPHAPSPSPSQTATHKTPYTDTESGKRNSPRGKQVPTAHTVTVTVTNRKTPTGMLNREPRSTDTGIRSAHKRFFSATSHAVHTAKAFGQSNPLRSDTVFFGQSNVFTAGASRGPGAPLLGGTKTRQSNLSSVVERYRSLTQ